MEEKTFFFPQELEGYISLSDHNYFLHDIQLKQQKNISKSLLLLLFLLLLVVGFLCYCFTLSPSKKKRLFIGVGEWLVMLFGLLLILSCLCRYEKKKIDFENFLEEKGKLPR